jgi:hypothetical protein
MVEHHLAAPPTLCPAYRHGVDMGAGLEMTAIEEVAAVATFTLAVIENAMRLFIAAARTKPGTKPNPLDFRTSLKVET